jgi:hypothetical protein
MTAPRTSQTTTRAAREAAVQKLLDRQAIVEVLHHYCRGVDRKDRGALERVYWPEAVDDHVHVRLSGPDYVEHVLRATATMRTAHHLGNILVEFDGPTQARCESYFLGLHEMPGEGGETIFLQHAGRYLDRFEKRGEAWRILARTLVFDFQQTHRAGAFDTPWLMRSNRRGGAFPDDPLYSAFASTSAR